MTVGATLGSAYRRVFKDAKTRLAELGKSYEESNKRLAAAGAVLKYKRQLDGLRSKQGQIGEAEKKALAAAEKRFAAAKKAAQQYGIEVGQAAEKHKKLTAEVDRMGREMRARRRMEDARGGLGASAPVSWGWREWATASPGWPAKPVHPRSRGERRGSAWSTRP